MAFKKTNIHSIPRIDMDFSGNRVSDATIKTSFYTINDAYKKYKNIVAEAEIIFSAKPELITEQSFDFRNMHHVFLILTFAEVDGYRPHALQTTPEIWTIILHRKK